MMKITNLNERGVSRVLILLIILFLLLLAGGAWWVWQSNEPQPLPADTSEATPSESTDQTTESDPTGEHDHSVAARPVSEAYSVRIPDGWVSANCEDNEDILFVAPNDEQLGKCASEFGGAVTISKQAGDAREPESVYTSRTDISDVNYAGTTVAGMEATRVAYTQAEEPMVGPPVGTDFVIVIAFDGTNSYILSYSRYPDWEDNLEHFDAIVNTFAPE